MLSELDESIRQILIHEGGFDPADVDVSFDIPNREWSAGISKPTLNCYLFDIHERRQLRDEGMRLENRGSRAAANARPPLYFDMTYLITAWTRAVEDEHRLLWHVLRTLVRFTALPAEHLQGVLSGYQWPIYATVAQLEGVLKSPGEFWTALENQLKPSLSFVITLGMERETVPVGPPVLTSGIRVRLPETGRDGWLWINRIFPIGGNTPLGGIKVTVEGQDVRTVTDAEGRFQFKNLKPGRYVVAAHIGDQTQRREIVIRDWVGDKPTTPFSDVVRDQYGAPVSGVLVEVEGTGASAITDEEGRFELELVPGRYIFVIHLGGWTQRREITVQDSAYSGVRFYVGGSSIRGNGT